MNKLSIMMLAALALAGCAASQADQQLANTLSNTARQIARERAACESSGFATSGACAVYLEDREDFDEERDGDDRHRAPTLNTPATSKP